MRRKEKVEPNTVQMGLRLPRELLEEAQEAATEDDRTVASIMRMALKEWLSRRKKS